MEWTRPIYSKGQIDRAAKRVIEGNDFSSFEEIEEYNVAQNIINNWRASHNFPLNTFQVTLRKRALAVDPERLVAQRIKRMSSIEAKLSRFKNMRMSQMQDIGGCRAILSNVKAVIRLKDSYQESDLKHKLDDTDDYIENPKKSGYRGIHMIYRYYSDRDIPSIYNGHFVEMQFRTRLQHTWATAVETVGTFLDQALKSSMGELKWLRFFALMGSWFALKEGCASVVPGTPENANELAMEIRSLEGELQVIHTLSMY